MTTQELVRIALDKAGGLNKFARAMGVTSNAAAQWRDGRNIPEWFRANRLCEVSALPLDIVQGVLRAAAEARSERRGQNGSASTSRLPIPPRKSDLAKIAPQLHRSRTAEPAAAMAGAG